MEVTQYLRQLTQRGEMYKYLNRYIIGLKISTMQLILVLAISMKLCV